jgi:hypothetical protein
MLLALLVFEVRPRSRKGLDPGGWLYGMFVSVVDVNWMKDGQDAGKVQALLTWKAQVISKCM